MESEPQDKDLMQAMSRLGVSGTMMQKLFEKYGVSDRGRLEYAVRETEMALKSGKVKKAAAWFVAAVERDDRAQGELFTPEQRAKEKKLQAAELDREAALRARQPVHANGEAKPISEVLKSIAGEDVFAQALKRLGANVAGKAKP